MATKKIKTLSDYTDDASKDLLKTEKTLNYNNLLNKRKEVKVASKNVVNPVATPVQIDPIRFGQEERTGASAALDNVYRSVNSGLASSAYKANEAQSNLLAGIATSNQNVFVAKEQDKVAAAMEAQRKLLEKAQGKITTTKSYDTIDVNSAVGGEYNGGKGLAGLKLGFTDHNGRAGKLTLNSAQAANARQIIEIGRQRGFSNQEIQIALAVSLDESKLTNLRGGDRDSAGLYQQRPSQGWGTLKQVTNTEYAINKFYTELRKVKPQATPWLRGQKVQRSYQSQGLNYKGYWGAAGKILSQSINPVGSKAQNVSYNVSKGLNSFKNKHLGQLTDFDKEYGTQCVDLYRYYMQSLGAARGPGMSSGGGNGGALELWRNGTQTAYMSKYATRVSAKGKGAPGDVAVFDGRIGNKFGHVGIVLKDNGNTVTILSSHSGNKKTDVRVYSKSSLAGYWRPNKRM